MAKVIKMPLLSDTMEEGVIADVFFKKGDKIEGGDVLAEVETDKATMEVEAYDEHEGTLLYISAKGDAVPVGGIMAITGEEGENIDDILADAKSDDNEKESNAKTKKEEGENDQDDDDEGRGKEDKRDGRNEKDIDLSEVNLIKMPLLSDTMEEGLIADVFFKKGDKIEGGNVLAEVETDKATMEVEAYDEHEGTLLYIAQAGDAVPVGGVLAITGKEGLEIDIDAILQQVSADSTKDSTSTDSKKDKKEEKNSEDEESSSSSDTKKSSSSDRIKASPLAKKMAEEEGLDLSKISGSGDDGRIVKRDIETALKEGTAKLSSSSDSKSGGKSSEFVAYQPTGKEESTEEKVSQMRKTIAKRLGESKYSAPHFYLTIEVNMDKMMAARKEMNEVSPVKISFNDLVMKASAMALRKHPAVNSSWLGDTIEFHKHIHVGMAVAIDTGLVVPVLRFADQMPLSQMAAHSKELAGKARDGKLSLEEMQGGTFSVSNLGAMGIEEFTAIINPPNAAILAVGGINKRMREINGEMKAAQVMKVTLSCDHRVVDGAVGSQFLHTFKQYMENPTLMLV